MPVLLSTAEYVEKLTAICMVCGRPASRSQRLINGKPAPIDSPVIIVGASESYEARCREHHEIPGANRAKRVAVEKKMEIERTEIRSARL
jgi:thymidine kinase